jgi:nitrite reductase/ring-hydroxylating ferredoxin subunit
MAEIYVAKVSDFDENDHRVVRSGELEIGVIHRGGQFYAYNNYCVHQGGPATEGMIIAKVEERIGPGGISTGMAFSEDEIHFVCPWHGYEYDLRTGECAADRRMRLRKFDVVTKDGNVFVVI